MVLPAAIAGVLGGAWVLLNNTPTYLNGTPIGGDLPLGAAPVGLLTYHASGHMSANLASTDDADRPMNLTYPAKPEQSDHDWALVGRRTLAYAGALSVSNTSTPKTGELTHGPLTVANVPSWTGTEQKRNYTVYIEGGGRRGGRNKKMVLHIYTRDEVAGVIGNLFWEKLG